MDKYTQPNMHSSAIIVIDMQNDFAQPGAIAEVPGSYEIKDKLVVLLNAARAKSVPVIHVVRLYSPDGSNVDLCRKALVEAGKSIVVPHTPGADILPELKPNSAPLDYERLLKGDLQQIAPHEWVLYKPRWGAFYRTPLEAFLRDSGIDTLVFAGCNFPNCPRTSIYEASERDFKIVLARDAMSQIYDKGMQEIGNIGVAVMTVKEIVDQYTL